MFTSNVITIIIIYNFTMYCYIVKVAISRLLQYCSQIRLDDYFLSQNMLPVLLCLTYMLCITDFEKICLNMDSFKFV